MIQELLTLRRKELGSNFQHVIPRSNTPMHIINWNWLLLCCGTTELIGVASSACCIASSASLAPPEPPVIRSKLPSPTQSAITAPNISPRKARENKIAQVLGYVLLARL
jgi:hypothetical protein